MRYPIAIEPGTENTAYGVAVPDLPGCFSAGDTMDEAIENASEAIAAWIDVALEDGDDIPQPGRIEDHRKDPDFDGWVWAMAYIDPESLSGKSERVNISIRSNVLRRIDEYVQRTHVSRSGFLASAAMMAINSSSVSADKPLSPRAMIRAKHSTARPAARNKSV